jgi:hypothetical protein
VLTVFEIGMIAFGFFMVLIGIPGLLFKLASWGDPFKPDDPET